MASTLRANKHNHERGWHRLFYTASGDLDLSWFLVTVFMVCAVAGVVTDIMKDGKISPFAWSFLAGAFLSVLIAAVPINKAKILANSKSIGEFSKSVASVQPNMYADNEVGGDHLLSVDREHIEEVSSNARELEQ